MGDVRTLPAHATCACHKHHHLNCAQYESLLDEAAGTGCQICGFPAHRMPQKKLYIDHSGAFGSWRVRGLLCISCNSQLQEDRAFSDAARRYLENAWFIRQCRIAGVPLAGGAEPDTGFVSDNFGRVWGQRDQFWLLLIRGTLNSRHVYDWRGLNDQHGPFNFRPVEDPRRGSA